MVSKRCCSFDLHNVESGIKWEGGRSDRNLQASDHKTLHLQAIWRLSGQCQGVPGSARGDGRSTKTCQWCGLWARRLLKGMRTKQKAVFNMWWKYGKVGWEKASQFWKSNPNPKPLKRNGVRSSSPIQILSFHPLSSQNEHPPSVLSILLPWLYPNWHSIIFIFEYRNPAPYFLKMYRTRN